ncbi:MAG: nicotinate (nicotinamide) nucleotide adenylyltransferase [Epsilonproteobacteria bacterium]|nr:nicotinate (nicotinamide) nucleotide adenylyltransferase [Campylobacterota bacterium]
MKTIALYGGSFDPPHLGHEAVVKALEKLDFLDEIIIMPTFLNPFKENFTAPAELRLQWLREIFSDYKKVHVSAFEVEKKRKVPAIETVEELLQSYDKIYFVIGADNLTSLQKWHRYSELAKLVTFIVATRDDVKIPQHFFKLDVEAAISSSELRQNMDRTKLPHKCAEEIMKYYTEHNEKQN